MAPSADLTRHQGVGLVFSGGGVLGAAHVGVLQVLRERDITPTLLVGTSAGALMATAYAAGVDPYELERRAEGADARLTRLLTWGTRGQIFDELGLAEAVEKAAPAGTIESLPVRVAMIAVDARSREAVILDSGDIFDALRAAIAIPGRYPPKVIEGRPHLDGGMRTVLPLREAFELGAEHVIGVRVADEWDAMPLVRERTETYELEDDPRVTMIRPNVGGYSQWIARDIPRIIALGRDAAERVLTDYPVVKERPRGQETPESAQYAGAPEGK